MNPTRIVSLAIGVVALLGVAAVALMGDRFDAAPQPTAEEVAAAAIAEGARQGAKAVAVVDRPEVDDSWEVDDGWGSAEDDAIEDGDAAPAPVRTVRAPAPAVPQPPSSSDSNPPVAVVLQ